MLVDKPVGPTSHDMVAAARRSLLTRRIGHSGTLDPFASGLLLLCVGRTTRLVEYLHDLPKEYRATARLGVRTTTDDLDGDVTETSEEWGSLDRDAIVAALAEFEGTIAQRPPMYSAKKVGGRHAYALAREGERVDLASVPVTIERIDLLDLDLPNVSFSVRCSTGTYIRAIARDLGDRLGVGAHLTSLRRTAIGPFRVEEALQPEELDDPDRVARAILPALAAVAHLPRWEANPTDVEMLATGRPVALDLERVSARGDGPHAVTLGDELVAVAFRDGEWLKPKKVFARG